MLKNRIFWILLTVPSLIMGANLETNSLISVLDYVKEDTLFIVDIDNTLIESSQHVGSIQWGDYLAEEYAKEGGKTYEEVDYFVSDYWCRVQPYIKVRCVDQNTPELFKKLHEKGITVLGLTARRPNEIDYTLQQLASVDIEMTQQILNTFRLDLSFQDGEPCLYDKGILFCTPAHKKSAVLKAFLNQIGYLPKRIIFIDDKLSHVVDLERFAKELDAEYLGIRFSGADGRVKTFNPEVANLQYEFLPALISDEVAEELVINKELILSYRVQSKPIDGLNQSRD